MSYETNWPCASGASGFNLSIDDDTHLVKLSFEGDEPSEVLLDESSVDDLIAELKRLKPEMSL